MTTDIVKQIRKATRRRFTAEEKIRIVLEGLRGEIPITDLCRKEGIQSSIYYKWSKAFLDSGKNGLTRETHRDATSGEVSEDAQRTQAGSLTGSGGLRVTDPKGPGSTRDFLLNLLSVETLLSTEGFGRTSRPAPWTQTGLESDPAPGTGSDPGDGPVVSRAVPTGGQLPGDGYLWVYGLGILGLPDSKGGRTDPGGSTPRLSGRIGVSNQDHENQPAVENGCDLARIIHKF